MTSLLQSLVLGDHHQSPPPRWVLTLAAAAAGGIAVGMAVGLLAARSHVRKKRVDDAIPAELRGGYLVTNTEDDAVLDKADLLQRRRKVTCAAQSISYVNSDPLLIVRGEGAYLIDEQGRRFLDTRNNVAHVGHGNVDVASAVSRQAAMLNTNTRYLHPNLVLLAEQLLATFPAPLCDGAVFFVNSGSEANDLALRLAQHYTRKEGCIVVDGAYHGHTVSVIAISPYKYGHPKYRGKRASWVQQVPAPDTYRGPHRDPATAAAEYAGYVKSACEAAKGNLAAFFIESGMSVAGVILPPAGYLHACYEHVRTSGGVCVADEVQTGLGRFGGSTWWGFEQQGVVPDIVTVGKPFGNGMPLAAVVCRREISAAFADGPEYFNTFGGNPVSCAAGLAVLGEIMDNDLRAHASTVGDRLRDGFLSLRDRQHDQTTKVQHTSNIFLGDVRGCGLFMGLEFVKDLSSRIPATKETGLLCTRLKEKHLILTSIDGPHDNVIVIKPPLVFGLDDAEKFIAAVEAEMRFVNSLPASFFTKVQHTPT